MASLSEIYLVVITDCNEKVSTWKLLVENVPNATKHTGTAETSLSTKDHNIQGQLRHH